MQAATLVGLAQRMKAHLALAVRYIVEQKQRSIKKYLLGLCHGDAVLVVLACITRIPLKADDVGEIHHSWYITIMYILGATSRSFIRRICIGGLAKSLPDLALLKKAAAMNRPDRAYFGVPFFGKPSAMSTTLSTASLPVFTLFLGNLRHLLTKAQADVAARGYDEQALVQYRLSPDMLPFKNQIFIACDAPKLCVSRITGLDAPKYDNVENTLAELITRVDNTVAWLKTVPAGALDGLEAREITFPVGKTGSRTMTAEAYVKTWALPNLFFHITTAYNILRHNGVEVGKIDYLLGAQG